MSQIYQGSMLYINGLPVALADSGGHASASEECWVMEGGQRVKKTFTNVAHSRDLKGTTSRIFVNGRPVATMASFTSKSYGDAESEGGVKSGTKEGQLRFVSGSPNVFFEGMPVVRHGDVVILNDGNSEETTWVQPSHHNLALGRLTSDPIENLSKTFSLNIALARNPYYQFDPVFIDQSFLVVHDDTGHKTYHTFAIFKKINNHFLWHDDIFREGNYSVFEIFSREGDDFMKIPLGKISTGPSDDYTPGLKLVPLTFLRYDDPESQRNRAQPLYKDTYLYLFKNGYLWRELRTNFLDRYFEVDLSVSQPHKAREKMGEIKQGILLPLDDANGSYQFHAAVSHIQWSWRMIHLMGGFDPQDVRIPHEFRLSINKNPELIKQRLQPIDITSVSLNDHLYWHEDRHQPLPHNVHPNSPEGKNKKIVLGTAICLLHDPLGRLIETSEAIVDEHAEYLAYSKHNTETYTLAKLVGEVIDTPSENRSDYYELVNDAERVKHMREYERKKRKYHELLGENLSLLKHWFELSFECGQVKDFELITEEAQYVKENSEHFHKIFQNIYAAFMISQDGLTYLQQEIKRSDSKVSKSSEMASTWLGAEYSLAFAKNMMGALATSLELDEPGINKLLQFNELTTHERIDARLITIPESELVAHQRAVMQAENKNVSTTLRSQKGYVSQVQIEPISHNSGRTITLVEFEGLPVYRFQNRIMSIHQEMTPEETSRFNKVTNKLNQSAKLRGILSALIIFNMRLIIQQIDEQRLSGDLKDGRYSLLHGELLRNMIIVSELSIDGIGLATKKLWAGKLSAGALAIAKNLNPMALVACGFIDSIYTVKYFQSGETALMLSSMLGVAGASILLSFSVSSLVFSFSIVMCLGFALCLISAFCLLYFGKSDIEKWLFDCHWGMNKSKKDKPAHSIEKFHRMMTLAFLVDMRISGGAIQQFDHHLLLYSKSISVKHTPEAELSCILELPTQDHLLLDIALFSQRESGLILLNRSLIKVVKSEPTAHGVRWEIRAPRRIFPEGGVLGRLCIQVYDGVTGAFLGKDAYELSYSRDQNHYKHSKVLYEFTGKT